MPESEVCIMQDVNGLQEWTEKQTSGPLLKIPPITEDDSHVKCRKWQITMNNPLNHGQTDEWINEAIAQLPGVTYYCMSKEIGAETGTPHIHLFLFAPNNISKARLKRVFRNGDFAPQKGNCQQIKDYVFKQGKWENDEKGETSIKESQIEWGEMPEEKQGARNDLKNLYNQISDGKSNFEIISENPEYIGQFERLDRVRQMIIEERYKKTFRKMEVEYICGITGSGKTRGIMEQYGYENVYRVTDYKHPFDQYQQQDVVIFEEFRSSMPLSDMLNLLDGYPVVLPCRYSNKIACYTKVYILTNIQLTEQYPEVQSKYIESWKAFLRRISRVKEYSERFIFEFASVDKYFKAEPEVVDNQWYEKPDFQEIGEVQFAENEQIELPF